MSTDYKSVFEQMQKVLQKNPAAGHARFKAETHQVSGLQSRARIRQFGLDIDEPPALAGTDQGPNPVELILAALGACQEITYRLYAEKLGIPIDRISVDVTGDLDLRGFFAVDDATRPGFGAIKASVTIDSPASDEEISRLQAIAEAHCPVLDILSQPTPVHLDIAREQASAEPVAAVA